MQSEGFFSNHSRVLADSYAVAALGLALSSALFSAFDKLVSGLPHPLHMIVGSLLFMLPFSVILVYLAALPQGRGRTSRLIFISVVDVGWLFYIAYPVS